MAVKLIPVKCPECGATLNIEENRTQAFCSYCGAKVLIHNENEFTYRHVDVAELERAETERAVKLKRIDYIEKGRIDFEKKRKERLKLAAILVIIGVILLILGAGLNQITGGDDDTVFALVSYIGGAFMVASLWIGLIVLMDSDDQKRTIEEAFDSIDTTTKEGAGYQKREIKAPSIVNDYEFKSYKAVATIFESAGFTNIKCVPLGDLLVNFVVKPGMVSSITINGEKADSDKRYPKDAAVVISYHSKA